MPGDELNLDPAKSYTAEEVQKLIEERNQAIERNRAEVLSDNSKLRRKLSQFEGIDVDEIKTMREEREKAAAERERLEREKLESQGQYASALEQVQKKLQAQIAERDQRYQKDVGERESFIQSLLINNAAIAELAKHSDVPNLLLPHVIRQMKVFKEEDGNGQPQYVARIVDERGNVRIGKGAGSEPMTLPELMDEMKQAKEYAVGFRGSGSSGGGASRSHASGAGQIGVVTDAQSFMQNLKGVSQGTVVVQRTEQP